MHNSVELEFAGGVSIFFFFEEIDAPKLSTFRYYKRSLYQHSLMNLHLVLFQLFHCLLVRCNLLQTQYIRCLERNTLVSFYNSCCCRSFRDFLPSLLFSDILDLLLSIPTDKLHNYTVVRVFAQKVLYMSHLISQKCIQQWRQITPLLSSRLYRIYGWLRTCSLKYRHERTHILLTSI